MADTPRDGRTDRAERLIKADPSTIYAALIDPAAVAVWLPPEGMKGQVLAFEPCVGGAFRMVLIYESPDDKAFGKTSQDADVVCGRFVALEPDRRLLHVSFNRSRLKDENMQHFKVLQRPLRV